MWGRKAPKGSVVPESDGMEAMAQAGGPQWRPPPACGGLCRLKPAFQAGAPLSG